MKNRTRLALREHMAFRASRDAFIGRCLFFFSLVVAIGIILM